MKYAVFERLLAARADKRPVVLVTALASGDQALVFAENHGGGGGGGSGLATEVVGAARDALRAGRSAIVEQRDTGRTFLHSALPRFACSTIGPTRRWPGRIWMRAARW
jgi:hypothetical protein